MSMALAGVGFSFGADTINISSAMSKLDGKMSRVVDTFQMLRAQAVDGIFDAAESGFGAVVKSASLLTTVLGTGVGVLNTTVGLLGAGFVGAGIRFAKFLGGPLLDFGSSAIDVFKSIGSTIADAFSGKILTSLTSGINLTAGLEAEMVGSAKTARELGANFGFVGKELDAFTNKATSSSIKLNIGAEQTAKALRGWTEAGDELRAMGFKSAEGLAKFTSAFGVDADLLRNSGMQLRREFKLTDDEIANFIGSTAKMGQITGDVTSAMGTMPMLLANMRDQASRMGISVDNAKLADFAVQSNALAAGFMKISETSEDARARAAELAGALMAADRQFEGMFAGVATEIPEFVKELAISTGDVNKAFKLMEAGPAGFVEGMTAMVAQAKKSGRLTDDQFTFIGLRLEKVLGKDASANLMNVFRSADASMLEAMSTTKLARTSLEGLANEAFRTGRTMQDEFDLATSSLLTRFRALGKPEARRWLRDMRKQFRGFGDQIKDLSKDKGPMGDFVRKLSEASSLGAQAFLPKQLQGTTMVLGEAFKLAQPALDAFGSLGINLTSLSGILNTVLTGMAVFGADLVLNKKKTESWGAALATTVFKFKDIFVDSVTMVGTWLKKLSVAFATFNFDNLFKIEDPGGTLSLALAEIKEELGVWADGQTWTEIAADFGTGFSKLWDFIVQNEDFQSGLLAMKDGIKNFITEIFDEIPWKEMISKASSSASEAINEALSGTTLTGIGWSAAGTMMDADTKKDIESAANWYKDTVGGQIETASDIAKAALEGIDAVGEKVFGNSINTYAQHDMDKMVEVFQTAATSIEEILNSLFLNALGNFEGLLSQIESTAAGIIANLNTLVISQEVLDLEARQQISPARDRERDSLIKKLTSDEAIHTPLWYSGSSGYERLFTAKMNHLIAAVSDLESAQRSSAPSARQASGPMSRPATPSSARVPPMTRR